MTYFNEILSPPQEPEPSLYEEGKYTRMSESAASSESLSVFLGVGRYRTADPIKAVSSRDQAMVVDQN